MAGVVTTERAAIPAIAADPVAGPGEAPTGSLVRGTGVLLIIRPSPGESDAVVTYPRVPGIEGVGVIGAGAFVAFGAGYQGLLPVRKLRGDWWELDELEAGMKKGGPSANAGKRLVARRIVTRYHGDGAASAAEEALQQIDAFAPAAAKASRLAGVRPIVRSRVLRFLGRADRVHRRGLVGRVEVREDPVDPIRDGIVLRGGAVCRRRRVRSPIPDGERGVSEVLVGATLPQFSGDRQRLLDAVRAAEDAGLDSLWVFDHLWPIGHPERPALHGLALLGALADNGGGTLETRDGDLLLDLLRHALLVDRERDDGGAVLLHERHDRVYALAPVLHVDGVDDRASRHAL